jgi:pimeloyl-ACP methyl ester carboxylesterase
MIREIWINTRQGRIFAKQWEPSVVRQSVPVILFHDSLGCVALWRDFPEQLAAETGRSVIAYDRLGFGQSDPCPGYLSGRFIQDEAGDTFWALREQLRIENFIAFGHSVGGAMAVACAGKLPEACQGLVTESAQAFVEDRTIEGLLQAKRFFAQQEQFERLEKYHGAKARWVLDAWLNTWLSQDFLNWNLDADLPLVKCPALLIHGDQDEYGSERHPERIARLMRGPATIKILPNCGHIPHRENRDAVIEMLRLFLNTL